MAHIKANVDLYTDAYGRLVSAGNDARMLVARAGRRVPVAYANQVTATGNPKSAAVAEDKAQKPAEDKTTTVAKKPAKKATRKRKPGGNK